MSSSSISSSGITVARSLSSLMRVPSTSSGVPPSGYSQREMAACRVSASFLVSAATSHSSSSDKSSSWSAESANMFHLLGELVRFPSLQYLDGEGINSDELLRSRTLEGYKTCRDKELSLSYYGR